MRECFRERERERERKKEGERGVQGIGCGVYGAGFRVLGLSLRGYGVRCGVQGLWFTVRECKRERGGARLRFEGLWYRADILGSTVQGLGLRNRLWALEGEKAREGGREGGRERGREGGIRV